MSPVQQPLAADTRSDIVATIRDFAAREIATSARARDRGAQFSAELWSKMAELGLHGLAVPAEHGGIGADIFTICEAARTFGHAGEDLGLGLSWLSSMYVTTVPLLHLGTGEQIQRYVPELVAGRLIGSQAITEPGAGSDVAAIRARAKRDGDGWLLNAGKIFITNAPVAGLFLVLAVTDPQAGRKGLTLFLVDRDTPGLEVSAPMAKMGNHASPTAEVFLDDCRVPPESVLGTEGRGFYEFLWSAGSERLVLTALTLGVLEAAYDRAVDYAQARVQFSRPISEFQTIRAKVADMRIAIDAADGLIARAAEWIAADEDARMATSIAKVFVSEAAVTHGLQAMQILGGYGYMQEYELERLFRDMKLMTVGGGTNEIHREAIAKAAFAARR